MVVAVNIFPILTPQHPILKKLDEQYDMHEDIKTKLSN